MDFPEYLPGEPRNRRLGMVACARRSKAIAKSERDLSLRALVAVPANTHAFISRVQLANVVACTFYLGKVPKVTLFQERLFLIEFKDVLEKNRVLDLGKLVHVGRTYVGFKPWSRHIGLTDSVLSYRVRVCIENVPRHAWQIETVTPLFEYGTFVEGIDEQNLVEKETACFCIWVWCLDPDGITKNGTLSIEEPVSILPPSLYRPGLGSDASSSRCTGPKEMADYNVLLHVDQIEDYSPIPDPGCTFAAASSTSGSKESWPRKRTFNWHLGVMDGCLPTQDV